MVTWMMGLGAPESGADTNGVSPRTKIEMNSAMRVVPQRAGWRSRGVVNAGPSLMP